MSDCADVHVYIEQKEGRPRHIVCISTGSEREARAYATNKVAHDQFDHFNLSLRAVVEKCGNPGGLTLEIVEQLKPTPIGE